MIELKGIGKTFPARGGDAPVAALADIDLSVERGAIYGIIGPSGAGKSTLVRVINRLEHPTAGQVLVDGVDMTALDDTALRAARRSIGMIFQHFNLVSSRTVFGNVALPLELAGLRGAVIRERVEPLLELVGLTDKRNRYPAELSGGQKQRVGIARALASHPRVLLCDEATSALDPETTRSILRLLADINRRLELTIVLITHEMSVIKEICTRVAVMDAGRIVEHGPVFDLFIRPQHEITRRFVASVVGTELPESGTRGLAPAPVPGRNTVLRIIFHGETATHPLISVASRRFGVDLNILHGRIDAIQGAPFGTLVVEAGGPPGAVQAVVQFLTFQHHDVEVIGYVPASFRAAG